jgi:hypothetical protein
MTSTSNADGAERRIQRLSAERTELFARGSGSRTLTDTERKRIREIDQTLEDCFRERRAQRAERTARRFS